MSNDEHRTIDPTQIAALRRADDELRALGFMPVSWWHPTTGASVDEHATTEPRFDVYDDSEDMDGRPVSSDMLATVAGRAVQRTRGNG